MGIKVRFHHGIRIPTALMIAVILVQGCTGIGTAGQKGPIGEAVAPPVTASETRNAAADTKTADEYLAEADYAKAFEYYAKAGDAAGLDKLALEYRKKNDYDGYVRCRQEAAKRTIIKEDFNDNSLAWNVRKDATIESEIKNGKLRINKFVEERVSYVWTSAGLAADRDFKIEAHLAKISGADDESIALGWGVKDANENFLFCIAGDGSYSYGGYTGGDWVSKIAWKETAALHKGNASNLITVVKQGNALLFSINGQYVDRAEFEGLPGTRVSIAVSPKSVIEVDSFLMEEYPSALGIWEDIGDEAAAGSQMQTAIELYVRAGNMEKLRTAARKCVEIGRIDLAGIALKATRLSERAIAVHTAKLLAEAGKPDEALKELERAGWNLGDGFIKIITREEFKDNSLEWALRNDANAILAVKDGVYSIEVRKEDANRKTWNGFDLSPDADFRIEADLRKLSGGEEGFYSMIWGFADIGTRKEFGLKADGSYFYGYPESGAWKDVIDFTKSPLVHAGNASNSLRIQRIGDSVKLSVNGAEISSVPFRELQGSNIGFAVYEKTAIAVDNLLVVEYPPAFALELAKERLFKGNPAIYTKHAAAMYMDRMLYGEALEAYLSMKDQEGAASCYERLGEQAEASGDEADAVEYYLKAGKREKIAELSLKAAEKAAAASDWQKAVELYLKAGENPSAYQGLAGAYKELGRGKEADAANVKLGDWYFKNDKPKEALERYLLIPQPGLLNAAAERYFKAGDYESAARLFTLAKNALREKDCYRALAAGREKAGELEKAADFYKQAGDTAAVKRVNNVLADRLLEDGYFGDAIALYKQSGNSAKIAEAEKKLKALGIADLPPEVVLCGVSSGTGVSLSMLFDTGGSAVLGVGKSDTVILSTPSEDLGSPWHFFTSSGDFCVIWGSRSESTVSEYTKIGSYHYYKDDQFWGPVFARQGAGEKSFGRDYSGNIWRTDGDEKTLIGETSNREVINAGGEKESVQMFRLKGENKNWITDQGGGIFQLGSNGKLLQIGWIGWRKITTPKGETFAILMTKGVTANAKWTGRYDGKLYRDK